LANRQGARQFDSDERPENRLIGEMGFASNRFGESKLTRIEAKADGLGPFVARFEIRQELWGHLRQFLKVLKRLPELCRVMRQPKRCLFNFLLIFCLTS
jgi:hypothetical protein